MEEYFVFKCIIQLQLNLWFFLFASGSWRSGTGFNALIHAHRPDLVNYTEVHTRSNIDNLNSAFDIAQEELGIARILDAEGKLITEIKLMNNLIKLTHR